MSESSPIQTHDVPNGYVLPTPGKWRMVKDGYSYSRKNLPSKAGHLTAVKTWSGKWYVLFDSKTSHSYSMPMMVRMLPSGNVQADSSEYAPAHTVKKAPPLPVPDRPEMTRFWTEDWDKVKKIIHRVEDQDVEKWPDPNRDFNDDDALVTSACGSYHGWVRPSRMQPDLDSSGMTLCRQCWSGRIECV